MNNSPSKGYKAIKIPEETYESLKELKKLIIHKGLNSFSENLIDYIPKYCPKCGTEMDTTEIKLSYYSCSKCQFKYPHIKIGLGGSLALGTLIGLGIAGLIYLLTKNE